MRIVALTSGPRQMIASLKTGASVALPRSTPASVLTRVITRLLAKPAEPKITKHARPRTSQTSGHPRH
jgi:hypothetical protein